LLLGSLDIMEKLSEKAENYLDVRNIIDSSHVLLKELDYSRCRITN
jgi:hypothetical protein